MAETDRARVDVDTVEANNDVNVVGGHQVKIGDTFYNVSVAPPPATSSIEELSKALRENRNALEEHERHLEDLVSQGEGEESSKVAATIRNAITAMRNIEILIPMITLRGGTARFRPVDARPDLRLNSAIVRGEQKKRAAERRGRQGDAVALMVVLAVLIAILMVALI